MTRLLKALSVGFVTVSLQQPHISVTGRAGKIDVTAAQITASVVENEVVAKGNALVQAPHLGITVSGSTISAQISRDADAEPFLKRASVDGEALFKFAELQAGGPVSATAEFSANSLLYTGTERVGHLHIENRFRGVFRQPDDVYLITVEGGTADFDLFPGAPVSQDLMSSGEVSGPIKMSMKMRRTDSTVSLEGSADRALMKLIGSDRTITLSGHVLIQGDGLGYVGNASGQTAILSLGPKNELKDIKLLGSPAKAEARPQGGGGS